MTAKTATVPDDALDIDAIIAAARPVRAEVPICLAGDLSAEHDRLTAHLVKAERDYRDSETGLSGDPRRGLAQQIRDLEQRMESESRTFVVQALPRADYVALRTKHTNGAEQLNTDPFLEALTVASIVVPEAAPDKLRTLLNTVLSAGQAQKLIDAAWGVNTGAVDVPFSRLASAILGTKGSSES